jgi:hypothetical protein
MQIKKRVSLTARTLINSEEVDKFLKDLADRQDKNQIKAWLTKAVKDYIKEKYDDVHKITKTNPEYDNKAKYGKLAEFINKDIENPKVEVVEVDLKGELGTILINIIDYLHAPKWNDSKLNKLVQKKYHFDQL